MTLPTFPLHKLGWKAFQDLCVALVEERLGRPVQTFLPTNDAGRDGAFRGTWDAASYGESTIQCKFTSKEDDTLGLSDLLDELAKAELLARKQLANDYIILTNFRITGQSELRIKEAFQAKGVGNCRVFHRDWISERIQQSSKLRMMVPRLYGLLDLTGLLDERAYRQAQLILSEMGDNVQKLVVTEAHRKSVAAISQHSLVLLLGSPAAGKSTIGASLALGASDTWGSLTIKSTSPEHLTQHIDPDGGQFFWIDDAWGSTQFQRDRIEAWNQVFPLMRGAIRAGSRFLITSRDYIWHAARRELKISALPILGKSQVVINVQDLTGSEKSLILYNHLKFGDQSEGFRSALKILRVLPGIAKRYDFLPESARRLGTSLFTEHLPLRTDSLFAFFARPKDFLEQTIEGLAAESRSAIALIFLNGGQVRSPVPRETFEKPAAAFGSIAADVGGQLEALNGSLLNLVQDEEGPYWTYRHPTVADAFASYVAKSPELVEIYLRGAKPETLIQEVVCAGVALEGALVTIPNSLLEVLIDRIANLSSFSLGVFISNRANKTCSTRLLELRPDLLDKLTSFFAPLRDDVDVDFLVSLHQQNLLPEEIRTTFVETVRSCATEDADSSFLDHAGIASVLTDPERTSILADVKSEVLDNVDAYIDKVGESWDKDNDPSSHFDELRSAIRLFAEAALPADERQTTHQQTNYLIRDAVRSMEERYEPPRNETQPSQPSKSVETDALEELFRDVDQ